MYLYVRIGIELSFCVRFYIIKICWAGQPQINVRQMMDNNGRKFHLWHCNYYFIERIIYIMWLYMR